METHEQLEPNTVEGCSVHNCKTCEENFPSTEGFIFHMANSHKEAAVMFFDLS